MKKELILRLCTICLAAAVATPAAAQDESDEPRRTRVALGPQLVPSYPGSDTIVVRPLIDFSRADAGENFKFEAPDQAFGFTVFRSNNFTLGPSLGFEGKRSSSDVGGLPEVDFTLELGGFAQLEVGEHVRFRAEARQGVTGHKGFVSVLSADYVIRDGDRRLLSLGPRVTITDRKFQNAYFGIRLTHASPSLPAFDAEGGLQSVGGAASFMRQLSRRWGIFSYAKFDRLIADPADSPVVAEFGSRNQFAGGVAFTYTFGKDVE